MRIYYWSALCLAGAALAAITLGGCTLGITPDQLNALRGDGACVGVVGSVNQPVYGMGGLGIARLNSKGSISVAKDGTISCTIDEARPAESPSITSH